MVAKPKKSKTQGPLKFSCVPCRFGTLCVAVDQKVKSIFLGASEAALKMDLQRAFPNRQLAQEAIFSSLLPNGVPQSIERYIDSFEVEPSALPLDPQHLEGSDFQIRVWSMLQKIPVGQTLSYQELAEKLSLPKTSARAVARACASNLYAVVVPCHRIIRADGRLAGYRWGLKRKRDILNVEESAVRRVVCHQEGDE